MTTPQEINNIVQTKKEFGDIPATYEELVDLDVGVVYNHIILINNTDQPLVVKFENSAKTSELEVAQDTSITLDDCPHWGLVSYKYVSDAPVSGHLQHISWGG